MKKITDKLKERAETGSLRKLSLPEGLLDFFSNDYLGLSGNKQLCDQIHQAFSEEQWKSCNGATGSRLLSGNNKYVAALEKKLAEIFQSPSALLFNSGYNANLSVLSSLPGKGDTILYDELIHASLKDGARLSFASRFPFAHNDVNDLEKKLKKATGEKFIVIESVYSMDGDFAPLEEIVQVAEKYSASIILDEAHSTGVWGEGGAGIAVEKKLQDKIFARIYTFGKAMGVHGACIAGAPELKEYLVNFARPFIYTTALPPHSLVSVEKSFSFLRENIFLQEQIKDKISFFRKACKSHGLDHVLAGSSSPVQVLRISGNKEARALAEGLNKKGFDVRAILSPTVKEGEERLRICLHVFNKDEEIENLAAAIKQLI